jgi:chromosome partitioning protein
MAYVPRTVAIIPMQCEYYALEGLSDLANTIKKVSASLNPDLKIVGLLRVMFDPRMTLSQQVSDHGTAFRRQGIPYRHPARNVRLAEAPSYSMPGGV